ncbi:MAG: hypothetical protein ACOZAM_28120 [Pseudomonadota bacterium]
MRIVHLLSLVLLTAPVLAAPAEENVTVRLRGALVEFEGGTQYAFYPRGGILVSRDGESRRGTWSFRPDRSAYCITMSVDSGPETTCGRIVRRAERYFELAEDSGTARGTVTRITFNRFKK